MNAFRTLLRLSALTAPFPGLAHTLAVRARRSADALDPLGRR